MKLNDKSCQKYIKEAQAKNKSLKKADGAGLFLHARPNGVGYWRYKYSSPFTKKEKLMALGVYPEISLAEARESHKVAHKLVSNGIDPMEAKKEERRVKEQEYNDTFEIIAREWHSQKRDEWSEGNSKKVLNQLEKDVFPIIGKYPIKSITHNMLLDLANSVKERGANELAKRIIQMCVHIYRYAIVTGRADSNIAEDLKGMVKAKPKSHYAAIEAKDIPQFMHDLRNHRAKLNRQTYLAVEFIMLTFVRTGEMIKAQWDEFDLENKQWMIPANRMKMGKEHIVPLSRQTLEILRELRELHNHPTLVFPSRNSRNKTMSNNTILMALKRMGYGGKMTGHGFRSLAMSTIMEKLGYRKEVPDAQLAHAKRGDVARAYERAKFLSERVDMMQEWADYLDEVSKNGRVIEFHQKAG